MNRLLVSMLVVFAMLVLGCQAKVEYWLNPDGTGKATFDLIYPNDDSNDWETRAQSEEYGRREFETLIAACEGVTQWADLRLDQTPQSKRMRGTAYFNDIDKVRLPDIGPWARVVTTRAGGQINSVTLDWSPHEPESRFAMGQSLSENPDRRLARWKAEAAKRVKESKKKSVDEKAAWTVVVHLPGKPIEPKHVTIIDGASVSATLSHKALNNAFQVAQVDESFLRERVGDDAYWLPSPIWSKRGMSVMLESAFGDTVVPSVKISPQTRPIFNYAKELAAHRRSYREVLLDAGLLRELPKVSPQDAFLLIQPGWIPKSGQPNRRAASDEWPGIGLLPPAHAHNFQKPVFVLITDANDQVLLPAPKVSRFELSYTMHAVHQILDPVMRPINFYLPKLPNAAPIKKVQGYIPARLADGLEELDAGEIILAIGAKSANLGIEVKEYSSRVVPKDPASMEIGTHEKYKVEMGLDIPHELRKNLFGISYFSPDGKLIIQRDIYPGSFQDNFLEQYFSSTTPLPSKMLIKLHYWKNPRDVNLPFEFEDFSKSKAAFLKTKQPAISVTP